MTNLVVHKLVLCVCVCDNYWTHNATLATNKVTLNLDTILTNGSWCGVLCGAELAVTWPSTARKLLASNWRLLFDLSTDGSSDGWQMSPSMCEVWDVLLWLAGVLPELWMAQRRLSVAMSVSTTENKIQLSVLHNKMSSKCESILTRTLQGYNHTRSDSEKPHINNPSETNSHSYCLHQSW